MKAIRNNSFTKALGSALLLWLSPLCLGQDDDFDFVDDGDFVDDALVGFADDEVAGFALDAMDVQSGEAQWATVGNEFQITASDGALIQYFAGFDIPIRTVQFIQPSSDATVINEIFTDPHFGTTSQIMKFLLRKSGALQFSRHRLRRNFRG